MNQMTRRRPAIRIDRTVSVAQAEQIACGTAEVALSEEAMQRCRAGFARLEQVVANNQLVYGITTGFGPLANRTVNATLASELQQNLVYHLATGVGPAYSWTAARAIVLARVMALVQGASGARLDTVNRLIAILNSHFAPEIPERGTVGASGDLTPLAHLVLCLQGTGHFFTRDGDRISAAETLRRLDIEPLDLSHRDGLGLVNGTSAMTGVAALNAVQLERSLRWSVVLTGAMAEALGGRMEAWAPDFAALRPHAGQARATKGLEAATEGSERVNRVPLAAQRLSLDRDVRDEASVAQDAYSLRCAPQVIGAVWDTADWHRGVVEAELCSVTDNPIFPQGSDVSALHGGNFMGCHVALASDAAAAATAVLAGFHERQIARMTDEKLNGSLPAFLSGGTVGLTSGLMGAQVTATALLAEIRCLGPASVQSISTNGANQDVVSQGTIAARLLRDKLGMLSQIQAIMAIAAVQAIDLTDRAGSSAQLSSSACALRTFVRTMSPFLDTDRPLGPEIEQLAARLSQTDPEDGASG